MNEDWLGRIQGEGLKGIFAIVKMWPNLKAAEDECIARIKAAASALGLSCIEILEDGRILGSDRILKRTDVDFAIHLHYSVPKSYDAFSFVALWNPVDFYHEWGYANCSRNLLTHEDFLSCSSTGADAHIGRLIRGTTSHLPPSLQLYHSCPGIAYPPSVGEGKLFYAGINWDVITGGQSRHGALLQLLDGSDALRIYGPHIFQGIQVWKGYRSYQRELPFDGTSVPKAIHEAGIALVNRLELNVSARSERYSDFGSTTKPKAAAKLRLPSTTLLNIVLRGSYSESFKAPDLGQLYAPQSNAVTTTAFLDPLRPLDAARQLPSTVGGNPLLKPEEGKVQYSGAVFEVPAVKGLSFSIDFFDVKITNVISSLGASYLLSAEGRRLFPNAITREAPAADGTPGRITRVAAISNNLGLQLYRGIDYGLRYGLRNTRLGSFSFDATASQVIKKGSDAGTGAGFFDNTGLAFDVEWRYNYSLSWSHKNWSARVAADVIGKYFNDNWTAAGWGENVFALVNPSVSYRGFKKTSLTLGVTNVFDARPPAMGHRALGFDDRVYGAGALGISAFVRARREF
jgi:hypothetical protein